MLASVSLWGEQLPSVSTSSETDEVRSGRSQHSICELDLFASVYNPFQAAFLTGSQKPEGKELLGVRVDCLVKVNSEVRDSNPGILRKVCTVWQCGTVRVDYLATWLNCKQWIETQALTNRTIHVGQFAQYA